jgi:hypothetical protein
MRPGGARCAITSAAGPFIATNNIIAGTAEEAALGGLASVAGGGKFADGAITGAFGYLFNQAGKRRVLQIDPLNDPEVSPIARALAGALLDVGLTINSAIADLAQFRSELGLEPGDGAIARLIVGGQSFYGINAHGQDISLDVNPISATHAETDVFQQAANAGIAGGDGVLVVDRNVCGYCRNGAISSLARQLGLNRLLVLSPQGVGVTPP